MADIVTDPDMLDHLNGGTASGGPAIVTDPDQIAHLEGGGTSSVPKDAVAGQGGLMWNATGGYDPNTGELVVGGKPFSESKPSALVAALTGAVSGVPIAGPSLESGVEKGAAGINSKMTGTPYDQNLSLANDIVQRSQEAHPNVATAGKVAGAVASTLPLAATGVGARALGMVGSIPARVIQGTIGGAAINAADSAARGENPITGAETGAALGAGSPLIGAGIGAAARGAMNMLPSGLTGPLADLGATAKNMLTTAIQGETPHSINAAAQTLGPQGFVGDINNPLSRLTKSVHDQPDQASQVIKQAYDARTAADSGRINDAITQALGPSQNLTLLTRSDKAAQSAAADPLYDAFRNTQIPPTPKLNALASRLNAAGVSGSAANKMAISGTPGYQQWFKPDPITGAMTLDTTQAPTAQTYDFMKQALDDKIGGSIAKNEKGDARLYQGLKSDLVDAIDNHPDPNVSGVWQAARQAFADPASIMSARAEGADALKRATPVDDLREQFNDYTPPEQQAFLQGTRGNIAEIFGGTKNGDTLAKNQLLAPNAQAKMQFLVGPDKAQALTDSLMQEDKLSAATKPIRGGSPTQENMQSAGLSGASAVPGAIANYMRNLKLNEPATIFGANPSNMIGQHEVAQLSAARGQIAPILATPLGPNADMAKALLQMSNADVAKRGAANRIGSLATALINGGGQPLARQYRGGF